MTQGDGLAGSPATPQSSVAAALCPGWRGAHALPEAAEVLAVQAVNWPSRC